MRRKLIRNYKNEPTLYSFLCRICVGNDNYVHDNMIENKTTRTSDFQAELTAIDPRLVIVPNPNRTQISNIKLDGVDICPIPAYEIRDETDPTYNIELPNGMVRPHKSKAEALAMVNHILTLIKTKEGADLFFDRNV